MAILHSQVHSFFGGDYAAALQTNPIVAPYVRAIGAFLIDKPVPHVRVRYEDLVQAPEREMRRILDHLQLPFEPGVVNYGDHEHMTKSYGDPTSVEKHRKPVTDSLDAWASDLLARPDSLTLARSLVGALDAAHLAAWGYDKAELFAPLNGREPSATRRSALNSYRFKRLVLLRLRKNIHHSALGAAVKKVPYFCDVLLRG